MMQIGHGAEAILTQDGNVVIKERLSKGYRIQQLDDSLRQFRTRREAKVLQRLGAIDFPAPALKDFCDKRMSITMDFVPGEKLKDILDRGDDFQELARRVGSQIGILHKENIVHGDLTTSNMIKDSRSGQIKFIDFGLSCFSDKVEDKAIDLFLLDRALESSHTARYEKLFEAVLEGYKESYPNAEEVLKRFKQVDMRGRNKNKKIN